MRADAVPRPTAHTQPPQKQEGQDGHMRIVQVGKERFLYVKSGGQWLRFKAVD